ncbi:MAG TPA: hypothetical protein PKG52_04775 [bacterium]|nr:hypothetical protein [bacterium]HPS29462.1 hypothetical protein [bacterium]
MEEAIRLMKAGEYTPAINAFKKIIEKDSSNGWAYRYCAMCYMKNSEEIITFIVGTDHMDLMMAKENMEKANELQPSTPEIISDMGVIESKIGNQEKAIEHFTNSLKINPENHTTLANRAYCLIKKGLFKESLDDMENAIRLSFGEVHKYKEAAEWLKTQINLENPEKEKIAFKKDREYK